MGSTSSSHLGSSSSTKSSASGGSRLSRTKRKLSNLFCGARSSKSTIHELEDCPEISSIRCSESLAPIGTPQDPIVEFSSVFTSEAGDTISVQESGDSSEGSSESEDAFLESMPLNVQGCRDPLPSQPAQELVCNNATECISEVIDDHDATSEGTDIICPGHDQSTNLEEGLTISHLQSNDLDYIHSAVVSYNSSDLRSLSIVSDSLTRIRFPGDDIAHVTTTSSPGFLVSESDQDLRSGDLLRLDLVSISSNTLSGNITEANSDESRRNSLRLFWDALSRRSLRRHSDAPTFVIASSFSDDWGSHNRWLLDFSGDLRYYGTGRDFDSFSSRLHRGNERRWLLRSEVSETTDFFNEGDQETTFCASGLHPDGTCSCDSFFTAEESSSLASISRIIMLAEALFEVLDEIHLQSLSLSLSTLSLPAPESVVDAFPLKYHKKIKNAESDSSDVRQCHICLCEYEDGDELRVLPCNHEYHVPCVDKWLKEVNRVCPLCRHDVCEGHGECSIPNLHESSS